jgi:hypothetical protein
MTDVFPETEYSTPEVEHRTGFTKRIIHYLIERGIVEPSFHRGEGSGDPHIWSYDDIKKLRRAKKRIEWGMTTDAAFREEDPPFPT